MFPKFGLRVTIQPTISPFAKTPQVVIPAEQKVKVLLFSELFSISIVTQKDSVSKFKFRNKGFVA